MWAVVLTSPLHVKLMADPSPIRLLLIEDSDIDAMFVTRLLQSNPKVDFEIDHATTLADALVLLREIEFDASLVDLHLPDAVELEAFEQIRALDARIPIVVFTGSDDENLALRAIESGAQDVMAKGHVTGQMLFRAVRYAIARQLKVMGFKADADTDPLTGMPNRRHLESQFVELHAISQQKNEAMNGPVLNCLPGSDYLPWLYETVLQQSQESGVQVVLVKSCVRTECPNGFLMVW